MKWISVEDRLPERDIDLVLICVERKKWELEFDTEHKLDVDRFWVTCAYCNMLTYKGASYPAWVMEYNGDLTPGNVLYWMPLPEPPEK